MNFGIQIEPQFGYSFNDIVNITNIALKTGFSTLWFSDHFMLDADATNRVLLDPWLLMAALTQVNKKVRVGSMVFCQSYRNPALTAKMAASLDVLSNGRFEFGIGAGWKEIEYRAYGYQFPAAKIRISQLAEAVQIIRGIWDNTRFTFSGEHYQVDDVISFPKPIQNPMPIWIGAQHGKELMLRVTARHGDGINIAWMSTPDELNRCFTRLAHLCRKFKRDITKMRKSVGLWTRLFESEEEMEAAILETAKTYKISVATYRQRITRALWGTADQIISRLRAFKEIGVSHIILMFPYQHEITQIRALSHSVLSHL